MEIVNKTTLNSIKKKNLSNFIGQYIKSRIQREKHFYLSAFSYFAVSGSGTIIPDPDPGKSSGSTTLLLSPLKKTSPLGMLKALNVTTVRLTRLQSCLMDLTSVVPNYGRVFDVECVMSSVCRGVPIDLVQIG